MDKSAKKPVRKALGRGLSSLISTPTRNLSGVTRSVSSNVAYDIKKTAANSDKIAPAKIENIRKNSANNSDLLKINIKDIVKNDSQPRQIFKEPELKELADSIAVHGIIQPIVVRAKDNGKYEIIAGERRWRAAQMASLKEVPVIIKNLTDRDSYELSIVENIQRDDLNPIEEARAYKCLEEKYELTQQEIAEKVGKERSTITNMLRLLKLPDDVVQMIADQKLSMGHAKAILAVREPNVQKNLAKKVVSENLSVRKLEEIVSRVVVLGKDKRDSHKSREKTSFPEITDRLRKALGTKVIIRHHKSGQGKVELSYFSEEELDRLVNLLCAND